MEDHAWETCKENVQPIKRGRSVRGLGETLAAKSNADMGVNPFAEQERQFEVQVASLAQAGAPACEQLDAYAAYFKWTRDAFPSSSERAQAVLERATAALKDSSELKNEPRFVKMWVEYADLTRQPGEIFQFMQSNKIGERVSAVLRTPSYMLHVTETPTLTLNLPFL